MTVVQVEPLEEVILVVELNVLINIFTVVATFCDVPAVDTVTLFFSPKGSPNPAEHWNFCYFFTHIDKYHRRWNAVNAGPVQITRLKTNMISNETLGSTIAPLRDSKRLTTRSSLHYDRWPEISPKSLTSSTASDKLVFLNKQDIVYYCLCVCVYPNMSKSVPCPQSNCTNRWCSCVCLHSACQLSKNISRVFLTQKIAHHGTNRNTSHSFPLQHGWTSRNVS